MAVRQVIGAAVAVGLTAAPARAQPPQPPAPDRERAVQCLAAAVAFEAGFEPLAGQQAVAEVVLNRVADPAYPKTVCGVVFAGAQRRTGCQFTFTCDGALRRAVPRRMVEAARAVAITALDGRNPVWTAGATHYHADYVMPYWAPSLARTARIGAHIFYRRPGGRDQGLTPVVHLARGEPGVHPALAVFAGAVPAAATVAAPAAAPVQEAAPAPFAPWGLPIAGR